MSESHDLGKKGEELASEYLRDSGFTVIFRNWQWGKHEIDIIAEKDNLIIFVEVKTRNSDFAMHPVTAITVEKQKSLIRAADGFIRTRKIDREARFDVISVIKKGESFETDHIEGAFYPTFR
jgi:putative endonuclease